mgnify:CR=1 FL=1
MELRSKIKDECCVEELEELGGVTGVWLATPVAELLGTVMAAAFLVKYRRRYGY